MSVTDPAQPHQTDLRRRVVAGAAWTVGIRWGERLLGLVSTLILARLLVPEDFGVVAMAYTVIGLVDVMFDFGVHVALIQNNQATDDDFHTAWTLRLLQSAVAAALVLALGPATAAFYGDDRLIPVMAVLAVATLLPGIENIGVVSFQKELRFARELVFVGGRKLIGFAVTIALALWLHDYWALVIGTLVGRLSGVALSYALHPFRPRPMLRALRRLLAVSSWVLAGNVAAYLGSRIDKFVVGRRTGADTMGAYTVADELAALPTTELLAPIGRVLFPAFSLMRDEPARLREAFRAAFGVQCLVAMPAAAGMAVLAEDVVLVLLGPRWVEAIPFVRILAIAGLALALSHAGSYVLTALGRVRLLAANSWAQFLLFVALAYWALPQQPVEAIATARVGLAALGSAVVLTAVIHMNVAALGDLVRAAWRPAAASAALVAVIAGTRSALPWPPLPALAIEVVIGGATFTATLLGLWWLSGRPQSAEALVLEEMARAIDRARSRRGRRSYP
ncbi:MAG: lipopolysaccharide biosynthesis protein [Vicinamibacterales bacterium]|nr:lipopolysaccharide biosynthesis protein [Vicinamibacterales bacterium]